MPSSSLKMPTRKDRINYIETTVSDYEKALKHKADSIARAEREKLERF